MERPEFDKIFMELAINIAMRSHCVKRHVGAVLTKDTRIISIGYNGPPAGTHNCDEEWPETGCERDSKGSCSLAMHAEQNALMYAVKNNSNIEGSTIYLTLTPCLPCARMLLSAGVKKLYISAPMPNTKACLKMRALIFSKNLGYILKNSRSKSRLAIR